MDLSDLLVSYNQVRVPDRVELPEITSLSDYSSDYPIVLNNKVKEELKEELKEESPTFNYYVSTIKAPGFLKVRGSAEFELAYDEVEKTNPEAKKYRAFLTKMAQKESGFNKSIQNLAGAPAYGYFQFMLDGKRYNNISKFAGTDIETFRNNPKLQIEAAIKLAKSFELGFSKEDRKLAKEQGFTTFGLLGGAWLAGNGGVRKFLKGLGNPSDRHWSKSGKGTDVASRIREFNFKAGGVIRKYLNSGAIVSDNTRVAKPIIREKVPRTYQSSLALFVLDNRSNYEKELSLKQAEEAYNLYMEDKRMEEGLNNLNGFLTFTDYATLGLGAGSLFSKGLKLIGKRAVKLYNKENYTEDLIRLLGNKKDINVEGKFLPDTKPFANYLESIGVDISKFSDNDLRNLIILRTKSILDNPLSGRYAKISELSYPTGEFYTSSLYEGEENIGFINGRSTPAVDNSLHVDNMESLDFNKHGISRDLYDSSLQYGKQAGYDGLVTGEHLLSPEITTKVWKHYPDKLLIGNTGHWHFNFGETLKDENKISTETFNNPIYKLITPSKNPIPTKHTGIFHPSMINKETGKLNPPNWSDPNIFKIGIPGIIGFNSINYEK